MNKRKLLRGPGSRPAFTGGWQTAFFFLLLLAITAQAQAQVQPPDFSSPDISRFGLLAGGDINCDNIVKVSGDAGAGNSIDANVNAYNVFDSSDGPVPDALSILETNQLYCNNLQSTNIGGDLAGQTLTAGVYEINGDVNLDNGSPLVLQGNYNDVFIFNIPDNLTIAEQSAIDFGYINPANIFWNVGGSVTIFDGAFFAGVIMAGGDIFVQGDFSGPLCLFTLENIELSGSSGNLQFNSYRQSSTGNGQHMLSICTNGNVQVWGHNQCSQLGLGWGTSTPHDVGVAPQTIPPVKLSNVVAVSEGGTFSMALLNNGTIKVWGDNSAGQLGQGYTGSIWEEPVAISGLTNVVAIAAGHKHALAMLANGDVYAWGDNTSGQIGISGITSNVQNIPVHISSLPPVKEIAAGGDHSLVLLCDGKVMAWGKNIDGQVGTGNSSLKVLSPVYVTKAGGGILDNVREIRASVWNSGAIMNDGTIRMWGNNYVGQLGVGTIISGYRAEPPTVAVTNVKDLELAGGTTIALLTNNNTMVWGTNEWGEFGDCSLNNPASLPPSQKGSLVPIAGPSFPGIVDLQGYFDAFKAIFSDGTIKTWGANMQAGPVKNSSNPHGTLGYITTPYNPTGSYNYSCVPTSPVIAPGFPVCLAKPNSVPVGCCGDNVTAQVLGTYGQLTTINAGGGVVTYSGNYLVKGPLEFTNGTFNLAHDTKFFVEPFGGVDPATAGISMNFGAEYSYSTDYLTFIKVNSATLNISGATLTTADCSSNKEKWGGITLVNTSHITTQWSFPQKQYSEISYAAVAIGSGQEANATTNTNTYSLSRTLFQNNTFGFWDIGKNFPAKSFEGINNCSFINNMYGAFIDDNHAYDLNQAAGSTLFGDYTLATYQGNIFQNNEVGVSGEADNIKFMQNQFINNSSTGFQVSAYDVPNGARVYIQDNTFIVPTPPVYGGWNQQQATGIYAGYGNQISGNSISGAVSSVTGFTGTAGIILNGSANTIDNLNTFNNLDVGVKYFSSWFQPNEITTIGKNNFTDNAVGVLMPSDMYSIANPVIRCNNFTKAGFTGTTRGIWMGADSRATALNNDGNPNGNYFLVDEPVGNDRTNNTSFTYHTFGGNQENLGSQVLGLAGGNSFISYNSSVPSANYCGGSGAGVNRVAGTGYAAILEMMDSLRLQVGTFADMKYYQQQIVAYHEQQNQLPGLEQYVQTLQGQNQEAYNSMGLYLMSAYRAQKQEAQAQLVKDMLLYYNPNDAEVYNRARYFDLTGRWKSTHPGLGRLSPKDSADLAGIAASGTSLWETACMTLRFFYKNAACSGPGNALARQAAVTTGQGKAVLPAAELGQSYPNPTAATAAIPYRLPKGTLKATIILHDVVTGRKVKTFDLPASEMEGNLTVELSGLSNGLYAYSLLVDGKPVATKKLAVMK